jgi:dTDP-4-dehydrorhamnose reductase
MKIIVLGASGMLGHVMLAVLSEDPNLRVTGTIRSRSSISRLNRDFGRQCIANIDVENSDQLINLFFTERPDVIVNCVGLIKQQANANDPLSVLPINALLPHRLANICKISNTRLIHISTDCVFSGNKGGYHENDISDAEDLYGKSKYIGEVSYPHCITLRTSIIGHELAGKFALLEWFLSQTGVVRGFDHAIFSGLPTVELSKVVRDFVLPNTALSGVYHIASTAINKYDLLTQIASVYDKKITIERDSNFEIDRSLNAEKFYGATGYKAPPWEKLLLQMHNFYKSGQYV